MGNVSQQSHRGDACHKQEYVGDWGMINLAENQDQTRDGNCLPLCALVLPYDKENYDKEMQCRIAIELVEYCTWTPTLISSQKERPQTTSTLQFD
ncbi:hypothetical protein RRG08_067038 [Elysia crispata]|uniref:Uncharacterized protein n=1 Tax=Elysia crispata TaxID=231223 RepID=A0AAE0ZZM4_9GAST|nr:hypothetical protein RRG08_067038 [Elysia crispata]